MRTLSCVRKPEGPDDSALSGNAIFSVSCQGWRLFHQCFNMFRADLLFRCGCERCYRCIQFCGSCYHLGDDVSLGTARTSSTVAALLDVPRGPVKLIGEFTVHTAGGTVVGFTAVCNHEAPLVLDCSRFAHLAETLRAPAGLLVVTRQETCRCMSGSLQS